MAYYTPELRKAVQDVLDQGTKEIGPITQWTNVLALLKGAQITYTVDDVSPTLMLVHPDNRSKLGVNAFNCHRTGAYIHRVGADLECLTKATAFEMAPMDPERNRQIAFNKKLVGLSGGMLAPVNGSERYMSVSCGHTAQFCKAAIASCKTPQQTLADNSGCINVQKICKNDSAMKHMLERGWSWTIIPWQCEVTWPSLPDLAQRALNASNSVASQASELEVAASIGEFAQMQQASDGSVNWQSCADAAGASMPLCIGYIGTICQYVRLYGGGDGVPMIKYLDEFSKTFGENKRLGEDYLKSVTEVNFGPSKKFPHIRTALLAANFVSPKVVDGVSRLLVKSDVDRLKGREKAAMVDELETFMMDAWSAVEGEWKAGVVQHDVLYPVIGKLHCRAILWATGKGKQGFEKKEWANLIEIKDMFVKDMVAVLPAGRTVAHKWFADPVSVSSAAPLLAPAASSSMVTMSELNDLTWVAKDAGFVIGKAYFEKSVGASAGVYILKTIEVGGCTLVEHNIVKGSHVTVKVMYDVLAREWAEFKGNLQARVLPSADHVLSTSKHMQAEINKATLLQALAKMGADFATDNLEYFVFPSEVRVVEKVSKGKLTLVPITDLKNIGLVRKSASITAQVGDFTFFLSEPSRARAATDSDWRSDVLFAPFWWVSTTSNKDIANMVEKVHKEKDTNVSVNVLVNSRVLQPHEALFVYKPKVEPVPLSSACPSKKLRV